MESSVIMHKILADFSIGDLVAVLALILAYLAYRKSVMDEYESWLDLAKSFQHELNYAKHWIGSSYNKSTNYEWVKPSKFVYPLTDEAAKALIWKGHPPQGIFSDNFFDKLAIYNERVQAFNHFLNIQGLNYIASEFETKNEGVKSKTNHINSIIHNELIGDNGEYHLHNLYEYFNCELGMIRKNYLSIIPWYLKFPKFVIFSAVIILLIIRYFVVLI
jgi:hypothetical protein